jgi:hypothetical protein
LSADKTYKTYSGYEDLKIESPSSWWCPTMALRFIERGGKKILQQRFEEHRRSEVGMEFDRPYLWCDVPLEIEDHGR